MKVCSDSTLRLSVIDDGVEHDAKYDKSNGATYVKDEHM
jgi:hypothetical protein